MFTRTIDRCRIISADSSQRGGRGSLLGLRSSGPHSLRPILNPRLPQISQTPHDPNFRRLGLPQVRPLVTTLLHFIHPQIPTHTSELLVPGLLRLLQYRLHTPQHLLYRLRQWQMSGFHFIRAHPRAPLVEPSIDDCFSKTDDGQSGEHVACAAEEAIDDGDADAEDARREGGTSGGAIDGDMG